MSEHTGSNGVDPRLSVFGANEWLVDEIYEQYLRDPKSVDAAWYEFFADYSPTERAEVRLRTDGVNIPAPQITPISQQVSGEAILVAAPSEKPKVVTIDPTAEQIRGAAARVVTNMEESLTVPTATSVRTLPATLLIENRTFINEHLTRARGGKISFTH